MSDAPLYFLIAGEASGDLLGARLMHALKKLTRGNVRFAGIGGPRMRAEGIELLFPQEELAHMGLFELLRHVPHILRRIDQTKKEIKRRHPAALITIDAPDFSFRVARKLKGAGIPLIHYVAPTVWAWRPGRAKKIAQFLNHLLALLPFEPPYFTREGLACTFAGHPIVESGADKGDAARFRAKYKIGEEESLIAVLPGSRMGEVSRLMPIFKQTVTQLRDRYPQLRAVMPVTPNVYAYIKSRAITWPMPVTVVTSDEDKYDALAGSEAALCCSGTIAIELAMARLPAVIAYKVHPLTHALYKRLIKVKYANLVNIMHNRMVVPELLQNDCTPEKLTAAMETLLTNEAARGDQIVGLVDVANWLGAGQFVPSERAAETVLALARKAGKGAAAPAVANPVPATSAKLDGNYPTSAASRERVVLQVVPSLVTGGVERGTVEVASALVAAGQKAVVASSGGPMAQEIEKASGVHVRLRLNSKNPLTMYHNIDRLAEVIRQYNVDIVHARSRAPAWSAWMAARRAGKPFVTTFHNAYGAGSVLKRFYNCVMARGDRVIAISNFVGDYATSIYKVPRERLRIIPRGVDIARFDTAAVSNERIDALGRLWRLPENVPIILLPGRLTRWKGQLVLVEALAKLGRRDVFCVIAGGGSYSFRQEIEEAAKRLKVDAILRVFDDCRDMPAAYALADVVVSASTRPEGFGRVIVEAQAMGCPVIATNHGGARETVIPGETGFLVPPNDADALARAIAEVVDMSPHAREALAKRSIAHIRENFTTAHMTARTLAVYDELRRVP